MASTGTLIRVPGFCGISNADDFIDPDPDIAGIGVILSFIIIGTTVMLLITIKLYIDYIDELGPRDFFLPRSDPLTTDGRWPGVEDARKFLHDVAEAEDDDDEKRTPSQKGITVLNSTLFGLADTQFATGIAICAAAMAKQNITGYHYLICDEMAWLALISSTGGLLTARTVFDSANIVKKVLRIALMWCLFGLVATVELRRNDDIGYAEEVYAAGPRWDLSSGESKMSVVLFVGTVIDILIDTISLVPEWGVLLYYYVETFITATPPRLETAVMGFLTRRCQQCAQKTSISTSMAHFIIHFAAMLLTVTLWLPLWILCLGLYWFSFQPVTAHVANCVFFFWGVGSAFVWRSKGRQCMKPEESSDEDQFGFGQVVALTLLISPLIANADAWYGKCYFCLVCLWRTLLIGANGQVL